MRPYKYSSEELLEIQDAISKELQSRRQCCPEYLKTVKLIGHQESINKSIQKIDFSTITEPIRLSHWSYNNLLVEQTVEKINDFEYLIKTTEYDECEDSDDDHDDSDDNFITQVKVLKKYYVSLPLLQEFVKQLLK